MKKMLLSLTLICSAVFVVGCGSGETKSGKTSDGGKKVASDNKGADGAKGGEAAEAKDIVDTAVAAGGFETLVAAVKAADLVETLKGDGPFTVFAPTDAAFKKLPAGTLESLLKEENKGKLAGILTYHVVSGKVMAADVGGLKSAKTVQGGEVAIKVEGDKVMVGGAAVTATDIVCSNGVIHVIDTVMLPKAE